MPWYTDLGFGLFRNLTYTLSVRDFDLLFVVYNKQMWIHRLCRMWGTLLADVVIQMIGTDYARILRAIYALAQVNSFCMIFIIYECGKWFLAFKLLFPCFRFESIAHTSTSDTRESGVWSLLDVAVMSPWKSSSWST